MVTKDSRCTAAATVSGGLGLIKPHLITVIIYALFLAGAWPSRTNFGWPRTQRARIASWLGLPAGMCVSLSAQMHSIVQHAERIAACVLPRTKQGVAGEGQLVPRPSGVTEGLMLANR